MVPPKDRRSVLFSLSRQTSISNKPPASQRAGGETVNYEVAYFIYHSSSPEIAIDGPSISIRQLW